MDETLSHLKEDEYGTQSIPNEERNTLEFYHGQKFMKRKMMNGQDLL